MPNTITSIDVRSVLTGQNRYKSIPYDYTINPFRGCLFGCSYCYASKFVYDDDLKKHSWGHWLEVKNNAVDALRRESRKLTGKTIFFSSATDPYQPMELRLEITKALLDVILFSFPEKLHIQTRSPHVVRDIPLFQKFGRALDIGISIPTDSDAVRKVFEPRAPSIARRLKAARELKDAGIRVTASIAPILPCTPARLGRMLRPCFHGFWVDEMHCYEKDTEMLEIYRAHGWERFMGKEHAENTREVLKECFRAPYGDARSGSLAA